MTDVSLAYAIDESAYSQSKNTRLTSDTVNDADVSTITTNDDIIKKMGCKLRILSFIGRRNYLHQVSIAFLLSMIL
jgi:hypothetical protein